MQFAVLGALQVRTAAGDEIQLAAPMRRQLLAALLCRAGRPATADTLIADLWGELPPRSAGKTLQSHVKRLRDDLGREATMLLRTVASGYQLEVGTEELDALRFEQLVRDAVRQPPVVAVEQLGRALELWRDDAYLEFGDSAFAVNERLRLTELRGTTEDTWTELSMGLGRAAELVGALERRVAAEPYRERSWEQLMLALYASGRQADALSAYERVRDVLATDLGVDPGPGLRELHNRILNQDRSLLVVTPAPVVASGGGPAVAAQYADRCPYPGLAGYGEDDAALFVGRERVVAELAGRVGGESLVVVTGPSGSGKSSLVHAGLLPALRGGAIPGSAGWRTVVCTPGTTAAAGRADVLVVDQAEELFTVLEDDERAAAEAAVAECIADGGRAVLVLRGDFFDRLAELPRLAGIARSTVLVRPMRDDEVRRAIVEPAAQCGCRVEPAMLEQVLDDISGRPAALPLLSVALVRAWRERTGDLITLEGYQRGGGMAGALEAGAEEAWAAIPEADRPAARRLLLRLVAAEQGGWVRRPLPVAEVDPAVLDPLAARRLVTVTRDRVELVHEALLQSWQRLRDWLEERARAAELLDHLTAAAAAWELGGRAEADLYRGGRLAAAEEWADTHPVDVGEREARFIAASTAVANRELEQARAQVAREVAGRRRLRFAVAALVAVLVATLVAVAVAVRSQHDAHRAAAQAAAAALTADARRLSAEALAAPDLRTGLLLAVAAYRLQPSVDTKSALLAAVEKNGGALWRIATPQRVQWVGSDAAGTQVWQADNQQTVTRYDARTRAVLSHFGYGGLRLEGLSPDGTHLLVSGLDQPNSPDAGVLFVLDARTGTRLQRLAVPGVDGGTGLRTAAFTGDGRWIVSLEGTSEVGSASTAYVDVYDTAHLDAPPRRFHLDAPGTGVAAGRSAFAVATGAGTLEIVDAASLQPLHVGHHSGWPTSYDPAAGGELLALAPNATAVAAVNLDGTVELWPATDLSGTSIPLQLQGRYWQTFAFSPDGTRLAVGSGRGDVAVVNADDGAVALTLPGQDGAVLGMAWGGSPDREELFTGGLDSQVVSWNLSTAPRMLTAEGPGYPVGQYGVHGHLLAGLDIPPSGAQPDPAAVSYVVTDLSTGARRVVPLHLQAGDSVEDATPDAAGDRAVVAVRDAQGRQRCELWDLTRSVRLAAIPMPLTPDLDGDCVISFDGSQVAQRIGPTRFALYRAPTLSLVRAFAVTLRGAGTAGADEYPIAFTPSGDVLLSVTELVRGQAAGTNREVALVDPAGRLLGQAALGVGQNPTAFSWTPDRTRLLVGTSGGDLELFAAANLRSLLPPVPAVAGYVLAASFSPDGSSIVTGGTDSTVRLFDAQTLRAIGSPITLAGNNWVYAGWTGQGEQIAGLGALDITHQDLTRYFTLPGDPTVWARTACGIAGSGFSTAEWARYVGDRPYEPVC